MLKTDVCDVLGITFPIIQGALGGPWRASAQLIAGVSNAGALGSIAATLRAPDDVRAEIAEVRLLTDKPSPSTTLEGPSTKQPSRQPSTRGHP